MHLVMARGTNLNAPSGNHPRQVYDVEMTNFTRVFRIEARKLAFNVSL